MPLSLDDFVARLSGTKVLPPEKLRTLLDTLPAATKTDGEELARELVRQKVLTDYQAQAIYEGKGAALVLGEYLVLDKIGAGGMGQVFKAQHRRMKRMVAIKLLPSALTKDTPAVNRFQREVEAAAKLSHPNIVIAHDAGCTDAGQHYLVMEYVEGRDLSAHVRKSGPLSPVQAVHCVLQVAQGLAYAHAQGIVHRDIKPGNLLLDRHGNVKILDMGLARLDSAGELQDELTGTGQIMGTVDYMAPEQARDTKHADARADIYSLGISFWYLLTGRPTYAGNSVTEKLLAHQSAPIPRLVEFCPAAPDELEQILSQMIAKRPEDRFQTVADLIQSLEQWRRGADYGGLQASGGSLPATSSWTALPSAGTLSKAKVAPAIQESELAPTVNLDSSEEITAPGITSVTSPSPVSVVRARNSRLMVLIMGATCLTLAAIALGLRFAFPPPAHSDKPIAPRDNSPIVVASEATPFAPAPDVNDPPSDYTQPLLVSDAQLADRLSKVDWQPNPGDPLLPGLVAEPTKLPGIPAWQLVSRHPHMPLWECKLSPSGRYQILNPFDAFSISPTDRPRSAYVRDTALGRIVAVLPSPGGRGSQFVFSPDEKHIAWTFLGNPEVRIYDVDGRLQNRWNSTSLDGQLSWSSQGRLMKLNNPARSAEQRHADGTMVDTFVPPKEPTGYAIWSPSGKYYVARGDDNKARIYTFDGGEAIATLGVVDSKNHNFAVWHPSSLRVSIREAGFFQTDYSLSGEVVSKTGFYGTQLLTWSADGKFRLMSNGDVLDESGKRVSTVPLFKESSQGDVSVVSWNDPGEITIANSGIGYSRVVKPSGKSAGPDLPTPKIPVQFGQFGWLGETDRLVGIDATDTRRIVFESTPQVEFEWDAAGKGLSKGRKVGIEWPFLGQGVLSAHGYLVNEIEMEKSKAVAFNAKHERLWEIPIPPKHFSDWSSWCANHDHSMLALASCNEAREILVLRVGKDPLELNAKFKLHSDNRGRWAHWSPDGSHLAACDGFVGTLHIWDLAQPDRQSVEILDILAWHWSPDGKHLAALHRDGITFWSAQTRELQKAPLVLKRREPFLWHPDSQKFLVDDRFVHIDGRSEVVITKPCPHVDRWTNGIWFNAGQSLAVVSKTNVGIWPDLRGEPTDVTLPYSLANLPLSFGARLLSPSQRYLAVTLNRNFGHGNIGPLGGDLAIIDLQERQLAWVSLGFLDGERIVVGRSGKLLQSPEDVDAYVQYLVRHSTSVTVSLTQQQFAARIGLSPEYQIVQEILDSGGRVKVAGSDAWIGRDVVADARHLPDPNEVVGVDAGQNRLLNDEFAGRVMLLKTLVELDLSNTNLSDIGLLPLKQLTKLERLSLSRTRVSAGVPEILPDTVTELDLSHSSIVDFAVLDLATKKSLRKLDLNGVKISDTTMAALRKAIPECTILP